MTSGYYTDDVALVTPFAEKMVGPSFVSGTTTFYEEMVYLSIESVWAADACEGCIGTGHNIKLVSLPTSGVCSICADGAAYPYHFGDLDVLLPASAWNCMAYCAGLAEQVGTSGLPSEEDTGPGSPDYLENGTFYVNDQQVIHLRAASVAQW